LTITSPIATSTPNGRVTFDYTSGTTTGGTIGNNSIAWNAALTNGLIGINYFVSDSGAWGLRQWQVAMWCD
jgi:hypothetical protein